MANFREEIVNSSSTFNSDLHYPKLYAYVKRTLIEFIIKLHDYIDQILPSHNFHLIFF